MTWDVMGRVTSGAYVGAMATPRTSAGELLKQWRLRRRFSQLDLATRAEVSTRHLSFVETGRAKPSPEMIDHLAEHLAVPLRERNQILLAAGYAPRYTQQSLDDPGMDAVSHAVDLVLGAHPYPAIVVDRYWNLLRANAAANLFLVGLDEELLQPPMNVMRISLHPGGLAPRATNFVEYAEHLVLRLREQVDATADAVLADLLDEVLGYVGPSVAQAHGFAGVVMPLAITTPEGEVRMFSTLALIGSPRDVTTDELTIEAFYPADAESRERLERLTAPALSAR